MDQQQSECPNVFQGKKIWVSLSVPERTELTKTITEHGGRILRDSAGADIKLIDPNRYSWKLIPHCIGKGGLVDLDDFKTGLRSGPARQPGSSVLPSKWKTPYTADEDRAIYVYVKNCEKEGRKALGIKIYQEWHETHPKHAWQSWRDRYLHLAKRLDKKSRRSSTASEQPPTATPVVDKSASQDLSNVDQESPLPNGTAKSKSTNSNGKRRMSAENAQPSPPSAQRRGTKRPRTEAPDSTLETPLESPSKPPSRPPSQTPSQRPRSPVTDLYWEPLTTWTAEDSEDLLSHAEHICTLDPDEEDEWFKKYAEETGHSVEDCRSAFFTITLPEYNRRKEEKAASQVVPTPEERPPDDPALSDEKADDPNDKDASRRSSSVPSLNFDVMERDIPRRSSEASDSAAVHDVEGTQNAHAADDDSVRFFSQEPLSSSERIFDAQTQPVVPPTEDVLTPIKESFPPQDTPVIDLSSDGAADPQLPSMELGGSTPYESAQSSPPAAEAQAASSEEAETAKIQSWLVAKCEEFSTSDPAPFVEALLCTSISLMHADEIVGHLVKGKPIPKDIRGVWTAADDKDLLSGDKTRMAKVVSKHGSELVDMRREYLERKAQLDLPGQDLIESL